MNRLLTYKDNVLLVDVEPDDYGDMAVATVEHVKGLFVQGTSQSRTGYVDNIGTDAHIYLDIENPFVKANAFRLEGMYVVVNLFGGDENQQWFKISSVKVGQRKLLGNEVNNVHCHLTKATPFDLEDS